MPNRAPFSLGTDSGQALRAALRDFISTWLHDAKYKARLPREHLKVLDEGGREGAGITIRVVSQPDPQAPWTYAGKGESTGRDIVEDWHQVALIVKADRKAGGAASVSAVFGALRSLFANRDATPERQALEALGVHECMETPEGLINDEGEEGEGTFFKQQIDLRCNTDTFLN